MMAVMDNVKQKYELALQQAQQKYSSHSLTWLRNLRQEKLTQFWQHGFPNRHEENWKYTDTSLLNKIAFNLPEYLENFVDSRLLNSAVGFSDEPLTLVFVDGYFNQTLSKISSLPEGVTLTSFALAQVKAANNIKEALTENLENHFDLLNTALMQDGMVLDVAENVVMSKTIHLLFVNSGLSTDSIICPRNIIRINKNSTASIVEEHISLNAIRYFKNSVTQIKMAENARLYYYKIQNESEQSFHIANTQIQQERDSHLQSFSISLGGQLARDDLQIALMAKGASCKLYGLYLLNNKQHVDHHTRIDHLVEHCESYQHYKGIMAGQATGVFNGKVLVHPHAQKTNAHQANENLLLSKTAEINTKPELEIYADDVKCSHGTTVGQLDDNALFYLRARGIPEDQAKNMLIQAFANEILQTIADVNIVNRLESMLFNKFFGA